MELAEEVRPDVFLSTSIHWVSSARAKDLEKTQDRGAFQPSRMDGVRSQRARHRVANQKVHEGPPKGSTWSQVRGAAHTSDREIRS